MNVTHTLSFQAKDVTTLRSNTIRFHRQKMTLTGERREIDVGDATHGNVIQYQRSLEVHSAVAGVEVGPAYIDCIRIEAHA